MLSAGPTPHRPLESWSFSITGEVDEPVQWTWDEFRALPSESITTDIHCVTKWSKLDTHWEGASVDTLLADVETAAEFAVAFSDGGYTTNLPLADVTGGKAWVAYAYNDEPLEPEHGGPARLLVPHLYFWKSAKWVRGLQAKDIIYVAELERLGRLDGARSPTRSPVLRLALGRDAPAGSTRRCWPRWGGSRRRRSQLRLRPNRPGRGGRKRPGRARSRAGLDQDRAVRANGRLRWMLSWYSTGRCSRGSSESCSSTS